MFIALFYTCKYKKCRGESNAEIKFRPGLVIKRDERVKREEGVWLIWCQGIDYFRFAAWLDCIVHTESDWGIWCVYMCVCVRYNSTAVNYLAGGWWLKAWKEPPLSFLASYPSLGCALRLKWQVEVVCVCVPAHTCTLALCNNVCSDCGCKHGC